MKQILQIVDIVDDEVLLLIKGLVPTMSKASGIYKIENMLVGDNNKIEVIGVSVDNRGELLQEYLDKKEIEIHSISREKDPEYWL